MIYRRNVQIFLLISKKKKKEPFIYLALTKYRVTTQKKKIIAIDPLGGITISTNKRKSIPQIGQREPSNHRHVSYPIVWKIDFPRLTHTHTHTRNCFWPVLIVILLSTFSQSVNGQVTLVRRSVSGQQRKPTHKFQFILRARLYTSSRCCTPCRIP